jgi:Ca2+-binding EF-hand superfamily protein
MRILMLAILAAAGYLTPWVPAACAAEGDAARLFASLDANSDGQLTAQEAGKEQRLLFKRLLRTSDENGDGRLSADELAAGLLPVRAEKELVEKQGSKLPGSDALLVMLARMDVNKDQQLDAKEIPADYRLVFGLMTERGDANKDGRLDTREIAQNAPQLGLAATMGAARMQINVLAELARMPKAEMESMERMDAYGRSAEMMSSPAQAAEMFTRLDANGDKLVSPEEASGPFADRLQQMLPRLDRDGDGKLSQTEFTEMARRISAFEQTPADPQAVKRTVRQLLKRFDGDGDRQLSVQELPRRMAENFDRTDQDANGKLDARELEAVAQTISRMQRGAAMRPGGGFAPARMVAEQADGPAKRSQRAKSVGADRREKQRKKPSQD